MGKYLLAIGLLLSSAAVSAQEPVISADLSVVSNETLFKSFEYQGFTMQVPANCEANISKKEAVLKCIDGTFGMSIKVEKDKNASPNAAVEMCRRMVRELDVKNSKITKVMIHGMQVGKLEGTTEGAPISVLILAVKGKYLKMVIINTPEHADWANIVIDSVAPLL